MHNKEDKERLKMALEHLTHEDFDAKTAAAPLAMVDFWASWCGPCKRIGPMVEKIAKDYDGKALVGKVNIDEEPELAQRFGVMSIPTLVFMKDGQEFDRKVGVMPPQIFSGVLDANLA
jgi:thioredoxin 1